MGEFDNNGLMIHLFVVFSLFGSAETARPCPESYAQLMQLFGRSVRVLGEWSGGRGGRSREEILAVLGAARHCAEVSAQGESEALLPSGYSSELLVKHADHLRRFAGLLEEAERALCEAALAPEKIKQIEEKLWRAAHAAHEELFAGKTR